MSPLSPNPTSTNTNITVGPNHLHSHPDLLQVFQVEGTDESHVEVLKGFKKGEVVAELEGLTTGATKAYSSVQTGPSTHIELNSSFLFVNHSCSPNIAFVFPSSTSPTFTPYVKALQDLSPGTTLTFFYPSTEWEMDRGFRCRCEEKNCLGEIKGAKFLDRKVLESQGYVAEYVWRLKEEQERETGEGK